MFNGGFHFCNSSTVSPKDNGQGKERLKYRLYIETED